MSDEIAAGDNVRLKSGGPLMTVEAVADQYGTITAWCDWFDNKQARQKGTFPVTSLVKE